MTIKSLTDQLNDRYGDPPWSERVAPTFLRMIMDNPAARRSVSRGTGAPFLNNRVPTLLIDILAKANLEVILIEREQLTMEEQDATDRGE